MDLNKYKNLTRGISDTYVNVHPIQRGGVLTAEARKALLEFGTVIQYAIIVSNQGLTLLINRQFMILQGMSQNSSIWTM